MTGSPIDNDAVSCSHWGMFPAERRLIFVPAGFKFSDEALAEWHRPGGIIMLEPVSK